MLGQKIEIKLGLIHITQKPVPRSEVGANAWCVCGQARDEVLAIAVGARRLGESACVVKPSRRSVVVVGSAFFVVVLLRGGCARHCMTPVFVGNRS